MNLPAMKKIAPVLLLIVLAGLGAIAWRSMQPSGPGANFASGNGRIEATEIDVATKAPGRIEQLYARDGDYVKAGQPLVQMQVDVLQAQRDEALARQQQAGHAVVTAESQVAMRLSDFAAAEAAVAMRESELDAARKRLARTQTLAAEGAASQQERDDDKARVVGMQAALNAAKAQAQAASSAVDAARAQVVGSKSAVTAAEASTKRIEAELTDSVLKAPRAGRVQFIIAHPGEVLGAGGKVLNLIDLHDVYMTFFLPEAAAGRVNLGAEVRILLDALPGKAVPAKITFVASAAQFTPKTVETANERQKLMFRAKAQIDQDFVDRNPDAIKTGVPGVAWVRLDPNDPWPANLSLAK